MFLKSTYLRLYSSTHILYLILLILKYTYTLPDSAYTQVHIYSISYNSIGNPALPKGVIESLNQAKTFLWVSQIFQSKFEANRSKGSWVMIGHTNRQTNRGYNFIYIDIYIDNINLDYLVQGCNSRKVISEVYTSFVLQCTVSGR